jgi:hypothetical protein
MEQANEFLISWSELVSGQASDLWAVGLGFLVAQILIVASLISSGNQVNGPTISVSVSVLFSAASLIFGYFVKGAVIVGIERAFQGGANVGLPDGASLYAVLQLGCLSIGILIFLVTFGFARKMISQALLGR